MARQRNGKIARLPHKLRERVNRALLDGQTTSQVLEWLNADPEAVRVFDAHFEGAPVNAENLSNWRTDGYRDWIAQREKAEHLKTLSAYANELAGAGGSISEGAQAILAGKILEALETAIETTGGEGDDGETADPVKRLATLTNAVASLRHVDLAADRIDLDRLKVKLRAQAQKLDREKFERHTVEAFLTWARSPEAIAILDNGKPRHVQMDALRSLMFGNPQPQREETR